MSVEVTVQYELGRQANATYDMREQGAWLKSRERLARAKAAYTEQTTWCGQQIQCVLTG
jgi:hypothetical protein